MKANRPDVNGDEWVEEMGQLILLRRGQEGDCWLCTAEPLQLDEWE